MNTADKLLNDLFLLLRSSKQLKVARELVAPLTKATSTTTEQLWPSLQKTATNAAQLLTQCLNTVESLIETLKPLY